MITLNPKMEKQILDEFSSLPLRDKLVIYAKLKHGNNYKNHDNDMFSLNKRVSNKLYNEFIKKLQDEVK